MNFDLHFEENKEFWDSKFSVGDIQDLDDDMINIRLLVYGMPKGTKYTFISRSNSKYTNAGINKGYYKSSDCPYFKDLLIFTTIDEI